MDELIPSSVEPEVYEGELVDVDYGKVLHLTPETLGIDFRDIFHRVSQYVNIADILHKVKKGAEYVVQIPAEFQGGFEAGKYWIMENEKTGKLWPTLMEVGADARNKIVTPLGVKKQSFVQGNPTRDIANSYHNMYLQQQMSELAGLIETTLQTVQRIEHGQMDDRIGLLEAGKQGVILALAQKDETSRSTAMLNAINNINVAQNQILLTFERRVSEFQPLPKSKLMQFIREMTSFNGYLDKRDNEYDEIQEYYGLYLYSTRLLAGAYAITGDTENAQRVFDMSIEKMNGIDFSRLKTIEYAHPDAEIEKLYEHITEYLLEEKRVCLEDAADYDCLSLKISGDYLLEALEDGTTIQSEETE